MVFQQKSIHKQKQPPLFILTGPTAVGKTQVAYEAALRLKGEIISCDSMQVYRGMDIGTSKPPMEYLNRVPHHLINILEPTESFDAARYRARALQAIERVLQRNRFPIVVGGTGLYLRVLVNGIFECPSTDPVLRQKLYQEAETAGKEVLYQRLKQVDPKSADGIHPNDLRKVIRGLEVFYQGEQPISKLKSRRSSLKNAYQIQIVGLNRPRKILYQRIDERVDQMFAKGLVQECQQLIKQPLSQTAKQALGYKEVFQHLEGKVSLGQTIQLVKRNTRRYAKRQLTWFRHEPGIQWIEINEEDSVEKIVERVTNLCLSI